MLKVIVLDIFCSDKNVMNCNYYCIINVLLLYLFSLIFGVDVKEEVVGVIVGVVIVVIVGVLICICFVVSGLVLRWYNCCLRCLIFFF